MDIFNVLTMIGGYQRALRPSLSQLMRNTLLRMTS